MSLRDAAQQALEALGSDNPDIQLRAAVTLRAALAEPQPQPEPVAWVSKHALDRIKDFDGTIYANGGFDDAVPLYTTPPQRQPLTIDEVEQIKAQHDHEIHGDRVMYIVRMTEKAHGIGGDK